MHVTSRRSRKKWGHKRVRTRLGAGAVDFVSSEAVIGWVFGVSGHIVAHWVERMYLLMQGTWHRPQASVGARSTKTTSTLSPQCMKQIAVRKAFVIPGPPGTPSTELSPSSPTQPGLITCDIHH